MTEDQVAYSAGNHKAVQTERVCIDFEVNVLAVIDEIRSELKISRDDIVNQTLKHKYNVD